MQIDATATYQGRTVRIVAIDADPKVEVLVVEDRNPDVAHYVLRDELTV